MGHRSISQQIKHALLPEVKQKKALEWAVSWEREAMELIRQLEYAIRRSDKDQLCIATGQLKVVLAKKFEALPKVLKILAGLETDLTAD